MIDKVIKLKLQYFKHVYVQATCQRDPEVYATCHEPQNISSHQIWYSYLKLYTDMLWAGPC